MEEIRPKRPWYTNTGAIIGLALGGTILLLAGFFIFLTGSYWRQIRQGGGAKLQAQFASAFSQAQGQAVAARGEIDRTRLELSTAPLTGAARAPIKIVEFIDFKCPNCQTAAPILFQVLQKFPTQVQLIARHFPVESTHPGATELASVGVCAHAQGRFWAVYDWFYKNQAALTEVFSDADRDRLVAATGLDASVLAACLVNPATITTVNRDYADALTFGVRGTPTFFINGEKVEGVIPFTAWEGFLKSF